MTIFNPLLHSLSETSVDQDLESTSALINDVQGECPKCKTPFGSALVESASVYYCEKCRVCQPLATGG